MIEPLTFILTNDFGGLTRGRGFPAKDIDNYVENGIGWVPANQAISPFDVIGGNPFGSRGDLRVMPDLATETRVEKLLPGGELHFFLGDLVEGNGEPWDLCPRSFLKASLDLLETGTGLSCRAAFEHEFALLDSNDGVRDKFAHSFALQSYASVSPFGQELMGMLATAGVEPEMFLPEYGPRQFEVTMSPSPALDAADRAVVLREIVKLTARKHDQKATFSPKVDPAGVGNGVHVHFSLVDDKGDSIMYDADGVGNLSERAASFSAGIVRNVDKLAAFFAPSLVSYLRLKPHHWSNAYGCVGLQNREATLRICPAMRPKQDPKSVHHLEFRATDATASPYIVLGCLIRAGLHGIETGLTLTELINDDPGDLTKEQRERMGVIDLPASLREALDLAYGDSVVSEWVSAEFLECYRAMKEQEMTDCAGLDDAALCRKYATVY